MKRHQLINQQGFSLVELLVAISILSIALLAVAGMQVVALNANSLANGLTVASSLAQAAMEDIMSWDPNGGAFDASVSNVTYDLDPKTAATSLTISGAGTFSATYSINTATPGSGVVEIQVRVTGGGRNVSVTSYKRVV
ncbi:MAG: prepilin-type N-terminal cleavage/methylation domain-containing protein [Deltaproteobacteria bacterium]|nr:prepilin-type N-terminal cleavage/methylation domain-containing protein [Deltaproteobacteria bacterium]